MNKIFKVVWSKVKRCYVVVSEVAKNVINGSVKSVKISGTPMTRGLALGAMMAFVITGNAWAGEYEFPWAGKVSGTDSLISDWNINNISASDSIDNWAKPIYVTQDPYGVMTYRKNDYQYNELIAKKDLDFGIGFIIAAGFIDASKNEVVSERTVIGNILDINERNIVANGYIELSGGYMGHWATGTSKNNIIDIIKSNIIVESGLGLYGSFSNNGKSFANANEVNIKNSNLYSKSYTSIYGGCTKNGNADSNVVTIEKSNIIRTNEKNKSNDALASKDSTEKCFTDEVEIFGGYTMSNGNAIAEKSSQIFGGKASGGDAIGNSVTINGSGNDISYILNSFIVGGYSVNGDAKNNIVNISNANLQGCSLFGGYSESVGNIIGNTLNVGKNITGRLNTISGFSAINFENIDWKHGGNIFETENLELVDTDIIIKNITGDPKVNDYMNLIVSDNQIVGSLANQGEQTVKVSAAQVVKTTTGTLEQEPNTIKFTIIGSELNPQVGALADASVVANAFVANGTGLVEDSINAMMCEERIGYKTFAQLHGSNLDFDTNNNLSVQGWSGIVGVGETTKDRLTYGVFFETGEGDYNTFAKQNEGYVRGDGEVDYNGGGLLVRKDYENGIYTEASLRAGRMNNEVRDAVVDSGNKLNGFDISSTYYGAHIGVGKIIPRGEQESLDIYGKFLYSHHDGDSFVIDGDTFNMDSVNSQRLRVGFRYNELNGSKLRMYYGAAYEYEFDAETNNTVLDYNFSALDLGGSTVVGELGLHYNADAKWCFDLNVRGYAGQREGFTGSVQANYLF